jgi:hypothetical protein
MNQRDALPMDAAFDAHNVERLRAAGTLLLGRRTFEMFQGFWPSVADQPGASDDNREISRLDNWEISRLDNAIDKLVISDSLPADPEGRGATPPPSYAGPRRTSASPTSRRATARTS